MRSLGAASFILAAMLVASPRAQQPFRSRVEGIRVDALVTNGRRPVEGLLAQDFEVRDNGVLQTVDAVALESMPLSVIFVLDASGSVAGAKMAHLSSAVELMLRGLRGQDRAALVTFSHRVRLQSSLTSNLAEIGRLVPAADAEGGTALNDAVYAGLAIGDTEDTRSLVVVFSDGLDNSSWLGSATVELAARRADAVVYGVAVAEHVVLQRRSAFGEGGAVPVYSPGQTAFLDAIAQDTGGRVIRADATENLPKAFGDILREFRTRYVLTYSARGVDTAGWHTIDVKVKGRRLEVRARRGYQR